MKLSTKLTDSDVEVVLSTLLNANMVEINQKGQYAKTPLGRDFFYEMLHGEERKKPIIEEDEL